jgi:hypothetical protein
MPGESRASGNHRPTDEKRLCLKRNRVVTGSPGQNIKPGDDNIENQALET